MVYINPDVIQSMADLSAGRLQTLRIPLCPNAPQPTHTQAVLGGDMVAIGGLLEPVQALFFILLHAANQVRPFHAAGPNSAKKERSK